MAWFLRDESDGAVALNPATAAPLATVRLASATLTPSSPVTAADTPDTTESAPAGINAGSHAGLSEVMTYNRDLVDGRYEYTGNQLVDAVLFGPRWTVTNITFSFPATAEFYETPYYQPGHLANHIPFNAAQQTAARYAFSLLASYTGLTFTEVTESADTHGIIRLSQTNDDTTLPSAEGNFPGSDASDGDIWFGDNNQPFYLTPAIGNWGQATMMHEIGHTMGLKHGHQDYTGLDLTNGGYVDGPGPHYGTAALPANRDGWAWSLMTYRSAPGFTAVFQGDRYNQPQTYMQADIAALQFMYGANFTTNATDSVYTFSATTGEMFINGVGQGTPEINAATGIGKIFRTLWDGNGIDTYNLANFGDNQTIDLRPGQFSTFSQAQLGDSRPLVTGFTAQPGNIANALLYQGDVRSLIENAISGSGNDILIGNQAANALTGNDGNDVLDGGAGYDVLTGGAGDDTYGVDAAGDAVVEMFGQGTDLVAATISYTLGEEVENLTLTGTGNIDGTGNALANRITGGAGSNVLNGLDGNDTLIGSYDYRTPAQTIDEINLATHNTIATALALSDFGVNSDPDIADATTAPHVTVIGNGAGGTYDMYSFVVEAAGVVGTFDIDLTAVLDSFIELYDASGTRLAYNDDAAVIDSAGGSYAANDSLLSYTFAAAGTYYIRVGRFVNATTSAVLLAGHSYTLQVSLAGNALPPLLDGGDWLDGGAGVDVLQGGLGNDTYVVDSADDVVTEAANAGTDTVLSSVTWSLAGREIENLTLTGTSDIDATGNAMANVLTGNGGHNHLDGGDGADSLAGGAGNDTYVVGTGDVVTELPGDGTDTVLSAVTWTLSNEVETLTLTGNGDVDGTGNGVANAVTGNDGANHLNGGGGDDTLTGGAGSDSLAGGGGNDSYAVEAGDVVTELAGEGTDTVVSAVTWTLSDEVEILTLTGAADIDGSGNSGNNLLTGNTGANHLSGDAGNDSLVALGGHDWLDGGSGADSMLGGLGDDTFVVDDAGDVVNELSGQGSDTVRSSITFTLIGKQVETVILTGAAAINATGNSFNNLLTGNDAANVLNGSTGSDTLAGMGGNDSLIGGVGADSLAGGLGDDTYVIDDIADLTFEADGEGTDLIQTGLGWTLSDHIENLTLTGSAAVNATGNGLGNVLTGNSGANRLDGGVGADTLAGGGGNDTYVVDTPGDVITETSGAGTDLVETALSHTLAANVENLTLTGSAAIDGTGNGLNNVLTGNGGNNVLTGGAGNDTYYVQNTGDNVVELGSGGTDVIYSTVTYSLNARYAETIILTGSANSNATGNSLANTLTGNDGVNTLNGKGGADILTGGLGADIFLFDIGSGADTVTDFGAAQNDMINIHAYTGGTANVALVSQSGGNVVIALGGSNTITVLNALQTDVLTHMVW